MSKIPEIIDYESYDVAIVQLKTTAHVDQEFVCNNDEFTDYYKTQSFYDMQEGIGQTYVLTYKGKVIGFISLAMAHMKKETTNATKSKLSDSNIPALLIGHLGTHKNYVKKGVGRALVEFAIKQAVDASKIIGCRYVMLNPEDDQITHAFYQAMKFTYIKNDDKTKDAYILDIQQERKN